MAYILLERGYREYVSPDGKKMYRFLYGGLSPEREDNAGYVTGLFMEKTYAEDSLLAHRLTHMRRKRMLGFGPYENVFRCPVSDLEKHCKYYGWLFDANDLETFQTPSTTDDSMRAFLKLTRVEFHVLLQFGFSDIDPQNIETIVKAADEKEVNLEWPRSTAAKLSVLHPFDLKIIEDRKEAERKAIEEKERKIREAKEARERIVREYNEQLAAAILRYRERTNTPQVTTVTQAVTV